MWATCGQNPCPTQLKAFVEKTHMLSACLASFLYFPLSFNLTRFIHMFR